MSRTSNLFLAIELSKSKWALCFSDGDKLRRRSLCGGDAAGLMTEISLARNKFGLPDDAPVHSCFEAGRDGFWLHRFLCERQIDNRVFDAASIEVARRQKHYKTDRIDAEKLVALLMRIVLLGERRVCAVVRVPTPEQEAALRLNRERERLIRERTGHRARIKALLALHGVRLKSLHRWEPEEQLDALGEPLPGSLKSELRRELVRHDLVHEQIKELEARQRQSLKEPDAPAERKAAKLMRLHGVGVQSSWILSHEFFWRDFGNRRQVGACAGLTGSPYDSGQSRREQGISKAGNRRVRAACVELAWCWLRFQPQSALSQWFVRRFSSGAARERRRGIVALARKLLVALWKYVEFDQIPQDARLAAAS